MKLKVATDEYLLQAKTLSEKDAELLFLRMGKKLTRRLEDKRLSKLEVLAIQLQLDAEWLQDWRNNLAKIRIKHAGKERISA
jgi:hypothetical protein